MSFIGFSALGLPIEMHSWGATSGQLPNVLILGGVHGDETEGVTAALGLLRELQKPENHSWPFHLHLIPRFNVDGVLLKTRSNFHGVDLNRNLPTKDWTAEVKNPRYQPGPYPLSEPENQALVRLLDELKPALIISL
ncbi:MAG: M14 family zinc carboxypeptidase, partial [Bdellovibrionaceae bacterium]|nr:M14 family zinc carboxypeptidase [Pseudobdellovibrionaceae bacterium]